MALLADSLTLKSCQESRSGIMWFYGLVFILCCQYLLAEKSHDDPLSEKAGKMLGIRSAINLYLSKPHTTSSLDLLLNDFCGHYASDQASLDSFLEFLEDNPRMETLEQGLSYKRVISCMEETGSIYYDSKSDVFALGYSLKKQFLKGQQVSNSSELENHFAAKSLLPLCVQLIVFADTIQFFNLYHRGYLAAQSDKKDSERRYVKTQGGYSVFSIRPNDSGGRTWLILNTNYNEYLFYSNKHYDKERGFIFTWVPGDIVCNGVFRFVAESNTDVQIWLDTQCEDGTSNSNMPVYAANSVHKWYVLYWLSGELVDEATWRGTKYSTALSLADAKFGPGTLLSQRVRPYDEVPGPKQLPILGNAWRFLPVIGHYNMMQLDQVMGKLHEQYGDVVRLGGLIGHPDLVFVFNPNEIEHVFKREEGLPHRPSMPSVKYYKQVLHKDFFGDNTGVVGVHGEQWDKFRAQVQQTMMHPNTAKKYLSPLNSITAQFLDRIESERAAGRPMPDFMEELYRWALECIGKVALDTRLGCLEANITRESEAQQMIDSVKTFFANVAEVELRMPVWRIYSTPAWKKYIGAFDMFRMTCMKYIEEAMRKLEARAGTVDSRLEEDIPIVERILMKTNNPKVASVLALDLLLVGIDTTSVAATTIIYHLAKHPDKQKKLHEELRSLIPDPSQPITEDIMKQATYLAACIKESLRMRPVIIGNGRSLTSDAEIGGFHVPKGTHVIFPHYIVSNLAQFFPEPEQFIPERWTKATDGCPVSTKIHRFASLPFGYGRRTCLGRRFAETELKILLAKIFRSYDVNYDGTFNYEVQSTYKPSHNVQFQFNKLD